MATTAIFGQAVYGDSRYGVLLVSGSSNVTFDTRGSLQASGSLKGISGLSFDAFGQGLELGIKEIYGKATLSFVELAELKGKTALKGSTNNIFNSSGSMNGIGTVYGNSLLTLSTNTRVRGRGKLSGSDNLIFNPTGRLRGRGRARGNTKLKFGLNGYLNRFVVRGSTTVEFTLKNIDYTLGTTLPWYNTTDPLNTNLPYDNSNLSVYYNLYEDTQGTTLLPYQETEEEIL